MEEEYKSRIFSLLSTSYEDRKNTLTWALMIWTISAIGLSLFMPAQVSVMRSIMVAGCWSAVHLVRRK